jgi:hypothetical protein
MVKSSLPMFIVTLLMLTMSWSQILESPQPILSEQRSTSYVGTTTKSTFSNGASELSADVGTNPSASIPLEAGYRLDNGSMNVTLEGEKIISTQTYSVASGTLNGTLTDTVRDGTSIQLMSMSSGPPGAGTNSSQLFNTVTWSGTHNYSTLELRCGISSCGKIIANGDLTIYVNTLIVEQGSMIEADDLITGGTGVGSSTTTPSNGRNDGGGGAGHGGAGGAGGGTNGGSGGSSYGNGSERGSQGGGVSSSYHSAVSGGLGGGYIRIFADAIYVNGSIQANGGIGDAGSQASSGTGPGGSGGGGGSGGSIYIQTNTLDVGTYGSIKSNGGDGGDGADGAQNGPGFGMYDGGDGGGGGAGGRIIVRTQSGGLSNSGAIQALGGAGGSKGLKYGTGVDGIDGTSGSNGVVTTQTWQGYVSQSNLTTNGGSFISEPLFVQSGTLSPTFVTHNVAVPADSSLELQYRWTINGTNTSFSQWSSWEDINSSVTQYPRMKWVQFAYMFNRTGPNSPTLTSIQFETSRWTTLSNAEVSYDGFATSLSIQQTDVGFIDQISDNSSGQNHAVSIYLPSDAKILEDVRFWLNWDNSAGNVNLLDASIDSVSVWGQVLSPLEEGHDIILDHTTLNSQFFGDTWVGPDGLEWRTLLIDLSFSDTTSISVSEVWMPYSLETNVNLTSAVNDAVVASCGSIYLSTAQTCLGTDLSHPLTVSGQSNPSGAPAFEYTFSDVDLEFVDDISPQVLSIEHRKGTVPYPDVRVMETFSLLVYDIAKEDDLTVEYLGNDWEEEDGFENAITMTYTSILEGYYLYFDTTSYDPTTTHTVNMTFRVLDAHQNELFPRPTYSMTLNPAEPEATSLVINGTSLISGTELNGVWEVESSMFEFEVTSAYNRSDLSVELNVQRDAGSSYQVPLQWNQATTSYTGTWTPVREDIGQWGVEVVMIEVDGLLASDPDGVTVDVDALITLIDFSEPVLTSIEYEPVIQLDESQLVEIEWDGNEGESVSGWISIQSEGGEIKNMTILPTTQTSASVQFNLLDVNDGIYSIQVYLTDDHGNSWYDSDQNYTFEIQPPFITGSYSIETVNMTEVLLSGQIDWRSGSGTIDIQLENSQWSEQVELTNGVFMQIFDLGEPISPLLMFNLTACDRESSDQCESMSVNLSFEAAFDIDVDAMCEFSNAETETSDELLLVQCQVVNNGEVTTTVGFNHSLSSLASSQSVELSPGEIDTIQLMLLNGTTSFNLSYTYSIFALHDFGDRYNINTGTNLLSRTITDDVVDEVDDDDVSTSASDDSGNMILIIALLLIAFLGGSVFTVRLLKQKPLDESEEAAIIDEKDFNDQFEHTIEPTPESVVHSYQPEQNEAAEYVPSLESTPTSYDEHGFEWYTEGGNHWYRQRDSQSEWTKYQ